MLIAMKTAAAAVRRKFPFASEFVTGPDGRISKVILDLPTFERLVGELEDEALARAMQQIRHEKPLSKAAALKQLARE
jgi:hypothetical protein